MEEQLLLLRSDRATDRRKGRKVVEDLLQDPPVLDVQRALSVLVATSGYVELEVEAARRKGQNLPHEAATLFRKCFSAFGKSQAVFCVIGLIGGYVRKVCGACKEPGDHAVFPYTRYATQRRGMHSIWFGPIIADISSKDRPTFCKGVRAHCL